MGRHSSSRPSNHRGLLPFLQGSFSFLLCPILFFVDREAFMTRQSHLIVFRLLLAGWILACASLGWTGGNAFRDPLPSWRDGSQSNKAKIIRFINRVTEIRSPDFVPAVDRVAVFDLDGTILCEKPLYLSMALAIQSLRESATRQSPLRNQQPYKAAVENDRAYLRRHFVQILLEAHRGYTQERYMREVQRFLREEKHPRWNRAYKDLFYQPVLELISFLNARDFKVCVVSGSWEALVRSIGMEQLGLDPSHLIGTKVELRFEMKDSTAMFFRQGREIQPKNLRKGKPINIWQHIGRRPIFAFGNSRSDQDMFEYTDANSCKTLILCLVHDDAERGYRYESRVKYRPQWLPVSMKKDFLVVFKGGH